MLFDILDWYGIPHEPVDVIRRLHKNFRLKFVLNKKNQCKILYLIGVR